MYYAFQDNRPRLRRNASVPCRYAGLGADATTDSVIARIRTWLVGTEVEEIAKYTHLLTTGIQELENRVVPESAYGKAAELTALANDVAALKAAFLSTVQPYVGPWWEKWKSFAINVTDARAVEAVLKQQNAQLMTLARRFEQITAQATNVPKVEPSIREPAGLIGMAVKIGFWAVGLGLLWYGGQALIRTGERRYSSPPNYARR